MKRISAVRRLIAVLVLSLLFAAVLPWSAVSAKTLEEWLAGFDLGDVWFGDDFAYDITDTKAVWELLMQPITVLDVGQTESVYPLDAPGGNKVNKDKLGGFINGASAAVHVLGEDQDGWTMIEGIDYYNRVIRGYVKTSLLKEVTPDPHYGIVVDKLNQRMYIFIDGELFTSIAVSTGLPNDKQPYNETAAGEYLMISPSGGFDAEGMWCDMAIRFNNGDKMHLVPGIFRADGSLDYSRFEPLLGQKASHGCIRVARIANEDGANMLWIWNTLRPVINSGSYPKLLIWDDWGREVPYPDDDMLLYYNPNNGRNYHSDEYCSAVKDRYLPLTAFTYAELDEGFYKTLTPCPYCTTVKRKSEIDLDNLNRGAITQEEYDRRQAVHDAVNEPPSDTAASLDDVEITISNSGD
ncbi:MAG TPA: L,D-transpeptidase [Candidatus Limiplasma sp.]|nr:L,D-transpeptidase [Candidatus Limiplasma sp.]HRX07664.1 L,D-transpeptidase [Candidatus Limiplasma sp.]